MSVEGPKRGRGRPRKEGTDVPLHLSLPKHHFDYLHFLVVKKHRLGTSVQEAAEQILIRELDALFRADYHLKEIPPV
jgi:hypothetical protein